MSYYLYTSWLDSSVHVICDSKDIKEVFKNVKKRYPGKLISLEELDEHQ